MLFLYNLNTEIHKLTFQDRHFYILTNREGKNMLEQSYYEKTDEIIELHGATASSFIPVMQDVQDKLGIPLAKAYSVATFYENFSFDPKGKYVIKVCDGTACHVRKSVPVREALEKHLGLGKGKQTTDDMLFTIEIVSCLGACGLAPVMTINDKVHPKMNNEDRNKRTITSYS